MTMIPIILALSLTGKPISLTASPDLKVTMGSGKSFVIHTDGMAAPKTVARIVQLVKSKFYDGQRFHRVEDWVVQWGAPQSKKSVDDPAVGNGGTGKNMPFEPGRISFTKGVCGVASTGAGLGGDSQLFIVKRDSTFLNGKYSSWVKVTSGMDVVANIKRGDMIKSISIIVPKKTAPKVKK